jgi:iron(II)-dependent oxidoreductase
MGHAWDGNAFPADTLRQWVVDARQRTLALVADLFDADLCGPRLPIVNPLGWEIAHVAYFQEYWVLQQGAGQLPMRPGDERRYDSARVPHDTRWDLALPSRAETLAYLSAVRDRVCERLGEPLSVRTSYLVTLSVFHEDMHDEAIHYTRQTHGLRAPQLGMTTPVAEPAGPLTGDVRVPGGQFWLGAQPGEQPFVFDNEKWAHPVTLQPFRIARAPVTQGEFAAFVADGGYQRDELWSAQGLAWRRGADAHMPMHWRGGGAGRSGAGFERRDFDRWVALEAHRPVLHVNAWEAEAFCRWAGRRLPTEAEWEAAAVGVPDGQGGLRPERRRFPWGQEPPGPEHANLDARAGGCLDVAACPAGDSAVGCRQMIGNVWEWTATTFLPYPGFTRDPYREYSEPWFRTHRVLRGGCWVTRGRLLRPSWRNFYEPHRADVWAGFRTCALDGRE